MNRALWSLALVGILTSITLAETGTAWTSQSKNLAFGWLDSISVSASASSDAPFVGLSDRHFNQDNWQADQKLPADVQAISSQPVQAGAQHSFRFSEPLEEGILLIDSFDLGTVATITTMGPKGTLELVSSSNSISFDAVSANAGLLRTTNSSNNGEGDAALLFSGSVTGIEVSYEGGLAGNDVFYGLTTNAISATPEPTSFSIAALALLPMLLCRRPR